MTAVLDRPTAAPVRLATVGAVSGVALDVGLRGGLSNLAVAVGVGAVLVALARRLTGEARWLVVAAGVPVAFLALRASEWLAVSNLAVTAVLVAGAVLHARSGSVLDTSPARLLRRAHPALVRAVGGPARLVPPGRSFDGAARSARGALVALPLLVVVVALLASADAVFASLLVPDVGPLAGHVVLAAVLGLVAVGVVVAADGDADDEVRTGSFGTVEVVTMLALTAAVLGLFVVAQLVGQTDAGRRLVEEAGLTPAEHARRGFFQLCWATGAVVALLGLVRALAAPGVVERRPVRLLGAAVPLLGLGLVAVSLHRMRLYDQAFGLTMLRLWVVGGAVWLGALLVLVAARNLGVGRRQWVPAGAAASAMALVLVADLANPEAFVVRHNVERARAGAELDVDYLGTLSADAGRCDVDGIARWNLAVIRRC